MDPKRTNRTICFILFFHFLFYLIIFLFVKVLVNLIGGNIVLFFRMFRTLNLVESFHFSTKSLFLLNFMKWSMKRKWEKVTNI